MRKHLLITKEHLQHMYVESDKTTYQIADEIKTTRKSVSKMLREYGIKIKRHKREYSFYYEQNLSQTQKELIIGSLFGDGHVAKHHEGINSCRFIESHSIKQLEYLEYKKNILQNFVSGDTRIIDNTKTKSYGQKPTYCFEAVLHKEFVQFRQMFYRDGIKIIPDIQITPFSLAIWYYDDGSLSKSKKNWKPSARFHTEGFSEFSVKTCQKILSDCFSIENSILDYRGYKILSLNTHNTEKLLEIISRYPVNCMAYKLHSYNPVET